MLRTRLFTIAVTSSVPSTAFTSAIISAVFKSVLVVKESGFVKEEEP